MWLMSAAARISCCRAPRCRRRTCASSSPTPSQSWGKLNYASAGTGSAMTHLATAYFTSRGGHRRGARAVPQQRRGAEQRLTGETAIHHRADAGARRASWRTRTSMFSLYVSRPACPHSNIPTVSEADFPTLEFLSWLGLLGAGQHACERPVQDQRGDDQNPRAARESRRRSISRASTRRQ